MPAQKTKTTKSSTATAKKKSSQGKTTTAKKTKAASSASKTKKSTPKTSSSAKTTKTKKPASKSNTKSSASGKKSTTAKKTSGTKKSSSAKTSVKKKAEPSTEHKIPVKTPQDKVFDHSPMKSDASMFIMQLSNQARQGRQRDERAAGRYRFGMSSASVEERDGKAQTVNVHSRVTFFLGVFFGAVVVNALIVTVLASFQL